MRLISSRQPKVYHRGQYIKKYWKISNAPFLNQAGEVEYIIHTTEDITDLVNAGVMEAQNVEFNRLIIQAPVGICVMNANTLISQVANERLVLIRTKELGAANEALTYGNQELARSNANLEEFAYALLMT